MKNLKTFTFNINERASCHIKAIGEGIEYADLMVFGPNDKTINRKPIFRAKLNHFMNNQDIPFMLVHNNTGDYCEPIHLGLLRSGVTVTIQLHVRKGFNNVNIEVVRAEKQLVKKDIIGSLVQKCYWCGVVSIDVIYYAGRIHSGVRNHN